MQGNVKLELFDKKGNLVQSRENHNMMTNFLNDFLLPIAATRQCAMGASNIGSIGAGWLHFLFGTLQLFSNKLSEDPNEFMSDGQKTVGISRYNLGYASSNPMYGSFNASESGWNDDRTQYTYVYDFPTSQANGTISSLGLSPIYASGSGITGMVSMDDAANYSRNGSIVFGSNISSGGGSGNTIATSVVEHYVYFDYENNYAVGMPYDSYRNTGASQYLGKTSKLLLNLRRFPLSKFQLGYNLGIGSTHTEPLIEQKEMSLKNKLNTSGANYGFINYYGGVIYACYYSSQSWPANESLVVTCLDVETWKETYISVKNTTGKTIYMNNCTENAYNATAYISKSGFCTNSHLVVRTTDSRMYVINLNDNNDVKKVTWDNGNEFTSLNQNSYTNAWFGTNNTIYYTGSNTSSPVYSTTPVYLIHTTTGRGAILANNANSNCQNIMPLGNYYIWAPVRNHPSVLMGFDSVYTTPMSFRHWVTPAIVLSTKMNLDEPVCKTADLTMKVTYKLTFNND